MGAGPHLQMKLGEGRLEGQERRRGNQDEPGRYPLALFERLPPLRLFQLDYLQDLCALWG